MNQLVKIIISTLFDLRKRIILKNKISGIYSKYANKNIVSSELQKKYKELWSNLGSNPDSKWLKVYTSISKIVGHEYITEIDYYNKVEPKLNNRAFSEAYCDKNFYHHFIDQKILPQIYLRNIEGVFYDENYHKLDFAKDLNSIIAPEISHIVIKKAVDSGGGRGVELFEREGKEWRNSSRSNLSMEYLKNSFNKNFIIQEYIKQHSYYNQFNVSSVNTVRILTYRSVKTDEIIPLQAVLRIGKAGAFVDNQASGGIACGIKSNAHLNNFAVNKHGGTLHCFNRIAFSEVKPVFKFTEMVKTALTIASKFHYHRLLGFDFSVNREREIQLIEINNRNNEINFYQMSNGPLFREYTDEVIDFCKSNKKTVCFDFEI